MKGSEKMEVGSDGGAEDDSGNQVEGGCSCSNRSGGVMAIVKWL